METLFELHNSADEDFVYGERLYNYCRELWKLFKLRLEHVDEIYLMSLEMPAGAKIESLMARV